MASFEKIQEAVDSLYHFRDHYFETHSIDDAAKKNSDVEQMMQETLAIVERDKDQIKDKAVYQMLRGKVLNVHPSHSQEAEDCLSKAVKLDPKLVEAWNQLGESFWKNGNVPSAKNCFTGALNHSRNKVSLRNLSMVLRQLSGGPQEKAKITEESVDIAKEAVQLDIKDGTSWLILGNAYLSLFFAAGQNPQCMKLCMKAYKQAEGDPVAKNNPDLHYNRAIAYKYQENYQLSLEGFTRATQLDPSWTQPSQNEKELLTFLSDVSDFTETKGKLKGKKLQTLIQAIKKADLGPYSGGTYTSPLGKTISLQQCSFKNLKPEINSEKVILGKVVCTVSTSEPIPFSFCMVDEEESCLPVTVYNLAQGSGVKIGDSVAIPEPFVQQVKVNHKTKVFDFDSLRVDSPLVLVVNGKKVGIDKQAPSVLGVSTLSD